ETVLDYFQRFKALKNRCFNSSLSEKDLADLAFNGLRSYLKEKLEGFDFITVNHLQMRAVGVEFKCKNSKDFFKPHRSNTHVVENDSDCSDDEEKGVYAAEFVRPSKDKPSMCPSLKPVQKNRQNEMKFTFDVSKCDRIFNELLKHRNIHLSHAIPSPEELKRHAYCKWHNSFSHATNDCNIFRRQIQSAVDERRLVLSKMQVDKTPFPVRTLELNNPKVLLRPEQAEGAQGKNVVIGDPRPMNANGKILAQEVVAEKTPDGKLTLRIFVNAPKPGGQASSSSQPAIQAQPVRPVASTGQTGYNDQSDRPRG